MDANIRSDKLRVCFKLKKVIKRRVK